jgi:hypothetical protein
MRALGNAYPNRSILILGPLIGFVATSVVVALPVSSLALSSIQGNALASAITGTKVEGFPQDGDRQVKPVTISGPGGFGTDAMAATSSTNASVRISGDANFGAISVDTFGSASVSPAEISDALYDSGLMVKFSDTVRFTGPVNTLLYRLSTRLDPSSANVGPSATVPLDSVNTRGAAGFVNSSSLILENTNVVGGHPSFTTGALIDPTSGKPFTLQPALVTVHNGDQGTLSGSVSAVLHSDICNAVLCKSSIPSSMGEVHATARFFLDAVTPGASYTTDSGHSYTGAGVTGGPKSLKDINKESVFLTILNTVVPLNIQKIEEEIRDKGIEEGFKAAADLKLVPKAVPTFVKNVLDVAKFAEAVKQGLEGAEILNLRSVLHDPPSPLFKQDVIPQPVSLQTVTIPEDPDLAAIFNNMLQTEGRKESLLRAAATALDRFAGALLGGDLPSAEKQRLGVLGLLSGFSMAASDQAVTLQKLLDALQQSRLPDILTGQSSIAEFLSLLSTEGFPSDEDAILRQAGFSDADIASLKQLLLSEDTSLAPESLSQLLSREIGLNQSLSSLFADGDFINENILGPVTIPEPSSFLLFACGAGWMAWRLLRLGDYVGI